MPDESAPGPGFDGLRVLLVEDEMLVAMIIEDMLAEMGCSVIGPAARVAEALILIDRETFDIAVLDVNVAGDVVTPVAEVLEQRGVPFVFSTGYRARELPERFQKHTLVQKPYRDADLRRALGEALANASAS